MKVGYKILLNPDGTYGLVPRAQIYLISLSPRREVRPDFFLKRNHEHPVRIPSLRGGRRHRRGSPKPPDGAIEEVFDCSRPLPQHRIYYQGRTDFGGDGGGSGGSGGSCEGSCGGSWGDAGSYDASGFNADAFGAFDVGQSLAFDAAMGTGVATGPGEWGGWGSWATQDAAGNWVADPQAGNLASFNAPNPEPALQAWDAPAYNAAPAYNNPDVTGMFGANYGQNTGFFDSNYGYGGNYGNVADVGAGFGANYGVADNVSDYGPSGGGRGPASDIANWTSPSGNILGVSNFVSDVSGPDFEDSGVGGGGGGGRGGGPASYSEGPDESEDTPSGMDLAADISAAQHADDAVSGMDIAADTPSISESLSQAESAPEAAAAASRGSEDAPSGGDGGRGGIGSDYAAGRSDDAPSRGEGVSTVDVDVSPATQSFMDTPTGMDLAGDKGLGSIGWGSPAYADNYYGGDPTGQTGGTYALSNQYGDLGWGNTGPSYGVYSQDIGYDLNPSGYVTSQLSPTDLMAEPGLGRTSADIMAFGPFVGAAAGWGLPAGIAAAGHYAAGLFGLAHDQPQANPVAAPQSRSMEVTYVSPQEFQAMQQAQQQTPTMDLPAIDVTAPVQTAEVAPPAQEVAQAPANAQTAQAAPAAAEQAAANTATQAAANAAQEAASNTAAATGAPAQAAQAAANVATQAVSQGADTLTAANAAAAAAFEAGANPAQAQAVGQTAAEAATTAAASAVAQLTSPAAAQAAAQPTALPTISQPAASQQAGAASAAQGLPSLNSLVSNFRSGITIPAQAPASTPSGIAGDTLSNLLDMLNPISRAEARGRSGRAGRAGRFGQQGRTGIRGASDAIRTMGEQQRATQTNLAPIFTPLDNITPMSARERSNVGAMDKPQGLIVHWTSGKEGETAQDTMQTFHSRGFPANYIIDRNAKIYQYLPDGVKGQHARDGRGAMQGIGSRNFLGVEIIAGPDGKESFNAAQIQAGKDLYNYLAQKHGWADPRSSILGHGEQDPGHKQAEEGMQVVNAVRGGQPFINSAAPTETKESTWGSGTAASPGKSGVPLTAISQALASSRSNVMADLKDNPRSAATLLRMAYAEAGSQGPQAVQAFMESVVNAVAANQFSGRGPQSIVEVLDKKSGYFPASTYRNADRANLNAGNLANLNAMLNAIARGSNVSNFATGNASRSGAGKEVMFGNGPQTAAYGPAGRAERYGIESANPGHMAWAQSVGYRGPASLDAQGGKSAAIAWSNSGARGYYGSTPSNTPYALAGDPGLTTGAPTAVTNLPPASPSIAPPTQQMPVAPLALPPAEFLAPGFTQFTGQTAAPMYAPGMTQFEGGRFAPVDIPGMTNFQGQQFAPPSALQGYPIAPVERGALPDIPAPLQGYPVTSVERGALPDIPAPLQGYPVTPVERGTLPDVMGPTGWLANQQQQGVTSGLFTNPNEVPSQALQDVGAPSGATPAISALPAETQQDLSNVIEVLETKGATPAQVYDVVHEMLRDAGAPQQVAQEIAKEAADISAFTGPGMTTFQGAPESKGAYPTWLTDIATATQGQPWGNPLVGNVAPEAITTAPGGWQTGVTQAYGPFDTSGPYAGPFAGPDVVGGREAPTGKAAPAEYAGPFAGPDVVGDRSTPAEVAGPLGRGIGADIVATRGVDPGLAPSLQAMSNVTPSYKGVFDTITNNVPEAQRGDFGKAINNLSDNAKANILSRGPEALIDMIARDTGRGKDQITSWINNQYATFGYPGYPGGMQGLGRDMAAARDAAITQGTPGRASTQFYDPSIVADVRGPTSPGWVDQTQTANLPPAPPSVAPPVQDMPTVPTELPTAPESVVPPVTAPDVPPESLPPMEPLSSPMPHYTGPGGITEIEETAPPSVTPETTPPSAPTTAVPDAREAARADPQTAQQIISNNPQAVTNIANQYGVDMATAAMLLVFLTMNLGMEEWWKKKQPWEMAEGGRVYYVPQGSRGDDFGRWPKAPTPDYPGKVAGYGREIARQEYAKRDAQRRELYESMARAAEEGQIKINPAAWEYFLRTAPRSTNIEDRREKDETMGAGYQQGGDVQWGQDWGKEDNDGWR